MKLSKVAPLLFVSGACALTYQIAWLRELRLIFGASTPASSAVLSIFLGGLGVGGLVWGTRVDRSQSPLRLYAHLELAIALCAAASPWLLDLARVCYLALGGSVVLGTLGGTLVCLGLSTLVLLPATLLLGGTLPAFVAALTPRQTQEEADPDPPRRTVAILYGLNTLGAALGAFVATFFLLPALGTRKTLFVACLVNALVGLAARYFARGLVRPPGSADSNEGEVASLRQSLLFAVALVLGFLFVVMELVWYRLLSPILGGSSFTLGLILSVALVGIALGGLLYGWAFPRRGQTQPKAPTVAGLSTSCAAYGLALGVPFALGDQLAILAALLRSLGSLGFWGQVLAWTVVCCLFVLPAATIAGAQFPLLIALLSQRGLKPGKHVGTAYVWNTAGSILGGILGGFVLLPVFGIPGCYRLCAGLLVFLGIVLFFMDGRLEGRSALGSLFPRSALGGFALSALALVLLFGQGPSAAFRHSGIGVGRGLSPITNQSGIREFVQRQKRTLLWEAEGRESSVALLAQNGLAFVVNGKTDGNARGDAGTQVMSGLLGALSHENPKSALVVGLGTGSTAGWLGKVPGIERVDVVEIEKAILHVGRQCHKVNQGVLDNPLIHVTIADAREVLMTTPRRYDLVFSEPSNPYRAGIASFYTKEFYQAVAARLNQGGLFAQWLQAYEVDGLTLRTIYATLHSVFPAIDTWQTGPGDMLLVASKTPHVYDVDRLRERITKEPYRSALAVTFRVLDLEGLFGHFVMDQGAVPNLIQGITALNTDDFTPVEYGFGRTIGRNELHMAKELVEYARQVGASLPRVKERAGEPKDTAGLLDLGKVDARRISLSVAAIAYPPMYSYLDGTQMRRLSAYRDFLDGRLREAVQGLVPLGLDPMDLTDLALTSEGLAEMARPEAEQYIEGLRPFVPAEADALLSRLRLRQGRVAEAAAALEKALIRYHEDPWPHRSVMLRALQLLPEVVAKERGTAARFFEALKTPFSVYVLEEVRRRALFEMALSIPGGLPGRCVEALSQLEPHPFPDRLFLTFRLRCYEAAGAAYVSLANKAKDELHQVIEEEPKGLAP